MVCIMVEGDRDKEFLEYVYGSLLEIEKKDIPTIEIAGGCTNIEDGTLKKLNDEYIPNGASFYIVYDMDNNECNKGNRKDQIITLYSQNGITITRDQIFLLPNDEKNGYLETIFFDHVPENRKFIIEEYQSFLDRVVEQNNSIEPSLNLYLPDHHNMAYVYANMQLNKNNTNDKKMKKQCPYAPNKTGLYEFKNGDEFNPKIQGLLDFLKGIIENGTEV